MRHLDLFSGIGGFALAARRCGIETVAFCEIDPYCQRVLKKHWPEVPCFTDVRELTGEEIDGPIDLISGGFPCQPWSLAGKQRGANDARHLWPEMFRLVQKLQPTWVLGENVPGLFRLGLDPVAADLESAGYEVWTLGISAFALGAPHIRERLWIVAYRESDLRRASRNDGSAPFDRSGIALPYANGDRCWNGQSEQIRFNRSNREADTGADVHDAYGCGCEQSTVPCQCQTEALAYCSSSSDLSDANGSSQSAGRWKEGPSGSEEAWNGWTYPHPEPGVCRVANGIPHRVDRLRGLGNSIVPQVAELLMRWMLQA